MLSPDHCGIRSDDGLARTKKAEPGQSDRISHATSRSPATAAATQTRPALRESSRENKQERNQSGRTSRHLQNISARLPHAFRQESAHLCLVTQLILITGLSSSAISAGCYLLTIFSLKGADVKADKLYTLLQ